jgi:hypothetical protein
MCASFDKGSTFQVPPCEDECLKRARTWVASDVALANCHLTPKTALLHPGVVLPHGTSLILRPVCVVKRPVETS